MRQIDLAKAIGKSQPIIAKYERGDVLPNILMARKISEALDTTPRKLVYPHDIA